MVDKRKKRGKKSAAKGKGKKGSRRRTSLGKSSRKNRQKRVTGKSWLSIPSGISLFKEEAGKTHILDIIPYVVDDIKSHPDKNDIPEDIWWKMPYLVHFGIGPDDSAALCPRTFGKKCPICELRDSINSDPDGDEEEAKDLRPKKRTLYAVRELKGKKKKPGEVKLWDISDYNFLDQLDEELDNLPEEYEDFMGLEDGYSLKIRFKKESFGGNPFAQANRIDFLERPDIDEDILDDVPALDSVLKCLSYDDLAEMLDDEEDEDGGSKSKKKKGKKGGKKKSKGPREWEDLEEMDIDDLTDVLLKSGLDEEDFEEEAEDEDDLREFAAEHFGIDIPEEEDDPEDEDPEEDEDGDPEDEGDPDIDQDFDDWEWDDLAELDEDDLMELVDTYDMAINLDDMEDEDELRREVASLIGIEPPKPKKKKGAKKRSSSKGKSGKKGKSGSKGKKTGKRKK